ncbi:BLUF domain-containing protein [Maricaulaceae bacterium EIL42A08]|nr:BLUF domain-containing protein [Maricaulaceae bacterium EIL42A08]MCP2678949.1 BLUF domain-containing protein [Maricaulaceae bacterium NA33B04]
MDSPITQLMYVSRSTISTEAGAFEAAIRSILSASGRHNRAEDITGALLYDRGRFLQWLEGPSDAVEARFGVIADDPRHGDLQVILRRSASTRRFAQWRMAFTKVGEAAIYRLPGLPLSEEPPEQLIDYMQAALADASTLSVAA